MICPTYQLFTRKFAVQYWPLAGLLTYLWFGILPIAKQQWILIGPNRRENLQLREQFRIHTGFPFNLESNGCFFKTKGTAKIVIIG